MGSDGFQRLACHAFRVIRRSLEKGFAVLRIQNSVDRLVRQVIFIDFNSGKGRNRNSTILFVFRECIKGNFCYAGRNIQFTPRFTFLKCTAFNSLNTLRNVYLNELFSSPKRIFANNADGSRNNHFLQHILVFSTLERIAGNLSRSIRNCIISFGNKTIFPNSRFGEYNRPFLVIRSRFKCVIRYIRHIFDSDNFFQI